jgi:hypothetical protein
MASLNWQKNEANGYYANHNGATYIISKRNDGYMNLWYRPPGGAWDDETKLNEKRIRVGPAKDMAENHAEVEAHKSYGDDLIAYAKDNPSSLVKETLANELETEFDTVPTVVSVEKTAETDTASTAESKQPEVEQRSDPILTEDTARYLLSSAKTKGERRKIRKELRRNGYPTLAGLAI